jgi:DNA polymerase III delta prime subunit
MPEQDFVAREKARTNGSAPDPAEQDNGRSVVLVPATEILSDVPVWAWKYNKSGCIQRGSLALFGGRPGTGKSTAARWFAARFSRGEMDGCWWNNPQRVGYIAPSEESLRYTIKPGLYAAGADMARIHFPKVMAEGKEIRLSSKHDEEKLTKALIADGTRIVVVDPIMSTISGKVDLHRNNEVREYIEPWSRIADAIDGIVIGIAHFTKQSAGGDIVAALTGSSAFGEVARSVFGFTKDPNSGEGHRVMSQGKNSTGPEDFAVTYVIESESTDADLGGSAPIGKFVILGDSDRTVSDVLSEGAYNRTVITELTDWLEDYLRLNGRVKSQDVKKDASKEGFSKSSVDRAAGKLKVIITSGGFPRITYWTLPGIEICDDCSKPIKDDEPDVHQDCKVTLDGDDEAEEMTVAPPVAAKSP